MSVQGGAEIRDAAPVCRDGGRLQCQNLGRCADHRQLVVQGFKIAPDAGHLALRLVLVEHPADEGALHAFQFAEGGIADRLEPSCFLGSRAGQALPFGIVGLDVLPEQPRVLKVLGERRYDGSLDAHEVDDPAVGADAILANGGGAAHAAECPLEQTVYEARDTGERPYGAEVARPDLAGVRFSVVRSAGNARVIKEEGFSEPTKTARLSLLVSGERGRFVIEREFASHSSPSITARSWPEASAEKRSDQSRSGAAKARALFSASPEISVLDGPLAGLMMKSVACRRGKQNYAQPKS